VLEITDSLLAPRDKLTGQGLTFIAHTVRELLTVCEGSTQRQRTIGTVLLMLPVNLINSFPTLWLPNAAPSQVAMLRDIHYVTGLVYC
jgi:hypothetical protein